MKYSLIAVKEGIGHDLNGVQGKIKRGTKKIVEVVDNGCGGELEFYWLVDADEQEEYSAEIAEFVKANATEDWEKNLNPWGFLFEHLLKLHSDVKDAKSMKPAAGKTVWLVK